MSHPEVSLTAPQRAVTRRAASLANYDKIYATTYKPGDEVAASGIYKVTHDPAHSKEHEVTVIYGKTFPPCGKCSHPRFRAVRLAQHITAHDDFK